MRRELGLVLGLVLVASPVVFAAEQESETPAQDNRPHVKVLENPRDISNFYTSQAPASPFELGYGYDNYDEDASPATDPYSISSFYQQNAPTGHYPIAGFYQQNQRSGLYPISGYYTQDAPSGRYPISGFYTQNGSRTGRYSRYWTVGNPRLSGVRVVTPPRFRRAVARELCFMAPTMLVPFVPFVGDVR
jgi:hypothetical protein